MWSLFMWAIVRFLVTGSMLGADGVVAAGGVGWVVAGVADRERAWAAAEARVVTILAAEMRDLGGERDEERCEDAGVQSIGFEVV